MCEPFLHNSNPFVFGTCFLIIAFKLIQILHKKFIKDNLISEGALEQVEIDIKYSGYINREKENADKLKRLEYVKIPEDIDYFKFSSLSNESKEKLNEVKPVNIGQAARISGIKPSDVSILLIYLGR